MTPPGLPPGWPEAVHPPGAPEWERTAIAWLYDQCPPDYRAYDVLRKHPQALGKLAVLSLDGAIHAADQGLRTARADLAGELNPEAVEAFLAALERERLRLRRTKQAAELVEQALRGRRWVQRL